MDAGYESGSDGVSWPSSLQWQNVQWRLQQVSVNITPGLPWGMWLQLICLFIPMSLKIAHLNLPNTSLHVPTEITERVKTGNFDQMFCMIRYQYVSKQFSVRLYSVRSPLVSSSDRVKSPVHLVGTTFPNSPSPSAVRWNPFRPSCISFPLRPIPF